MFNKNSAHNFDENFYGVLDEKLQSFRFRFFSPTDKGAEREFGDAVNNPKSLFSQHPEDYSLYLLGRIDSTTGFIEAQCPALLLGRASEFVIVKTINEAIHASGGQS